MSKKEEKPSPDERLKLWVTVGEHLKEIRKLETDSAEQAKQARELLGKMNGWDLIVLNEDTLEALKNPMETLEALWRPFDIGEPDGRAPYGKDPFTYADSLKD